ncbi:metal-sulfur cluster assembly factor [Methanosarcina sp. UBA289]|uniref:metal-sulfur cluster assembly factor n=1 Tax=Methanosarcina sp. UBA289 TaxID=1915574 RepID=UPI00374450C4
MAPQSTEIRKEDQIYSRLKEVIDPEVGMDIIKMGFVKEVNVNGTSVDVNLVLTTSACPMIEYFKDEVKRKVLSIGGIEDVSVNILDEPWSWDRLKKQVVH